jgi:GT2 family glycosyltransferase
VESYPKSLAAVESGHKLTGADKAAESLPLISLIIVNWNGRELLDSCLRSIRSCTYPKLEVIVFDNGSTDGSQRIIKESFPFVRLIENHHNIGYALGNNSAVNAARGEYFFLLNNDATIEPGCIDHLVGVALDNEKAGILGCKIYLAGVGERTLEHAGGVLFPTGYTANRGYMERDTGQYDDICEVDYVVGAAMMVSKRLTNRVGLFDRTFSLYYEDTDLCQRAKKAGFKVLYVPMAKAHHAHSATADRLLGELGKLARFEKSRIYFVLGNFEARKLIQWLLLELWMLGSMIVRRIEPRTGEHLLALFESYVWNILFLPKTAKRRIWYRIVSFRCPRT